MAQSVELQTGKHEVVCATSSRIMFFVAKMPTTDVSIRKVVSELACLHAACI